MHIPKGIILTIGLLSIMVAAGLLVALTLFAGRTWKFEGATPKEHTNVAPATTSGGICFSLHISTH